MQVRYGSLFFPADSVGVSRAIQVVEETDGGIPIVYEWKYDCTAFIHSTQTTTTAIQRDLANQERTIRQSLSIPRQPFLVLLDDGSLSDMALFPGGNVLDGPLVKMFANPVAGGPEYAARRTISFSVSAKVAVSGADLILLSFSEIIRTTGDGGPVFDDFVTIDNVAVRQQLYARSVCRATQSGSMTAFSRELGPGDAPRPLWPGDYRGNETDITIGSPIRMPAGYIKYPLSWSYSFVRAGIPFVGLPNRQV